MPELGPVTAAARLSHRDGTYRFDDLNFTLGAKDTPQINVIDIEFSVIEIPIKTSEMSALKN